MSNIIKSFLRQDAYFYAVLLVIIALASFGLGRLSMIEQSTQQSASVVMVQDGVSSEGGAQVAMELVASKNGTKYHALWCPGASQIKDENKITFHSEKEAQAAGYSLAANCAW